LDSHQFRSRTGVSYAGVRRNGLAVRPNPQARIVPGADRNLQLPTDTWQVTEVVGFGNDALEHETKSSEFNEISCVPKATPSLIVGEKSPVHLPRVLGSSLVRVNE